MQKNRDDLVQKLKDEKYSVVLMRDQTTEFLVKEHSMKIAIISEDFVDQEFLAKSFREYAEVRVFNGI